MPLQATSGAASYDAFGGGVAAAPNYIEDVFSTWLYTGTGSNGLQIQNGIDLAGKGGLVIGKARSGANAGTVDWGWIDTARGGSSVLYSNSNAAAASTSQISSFNADGFTLNGAWPLNFYGSPYTYGSWTFREQPKFFDVVTWTGNGANYRAISHSLGSTPGMVIVKSTSASGAWAVWHRSVDPNNLILNSTSAAISGQYSIQDVGSTSFAVANSSFYGFPQSIPVNDNGATYVAYLFAHNAGGFGLTGTDNVISCGSYTGNGATDGPVVNLGYEPQWLLIKKASGGTFSVGSSSWVLLDTMRGIATNSGGVNPVLYPNLSDAENGRGTGVFAYVNATGFSLVNGTNLANENGATYIYIAIRRGPMRTPTTGTSVFSPNAQNTGTTPLVTTNFPVDLSIGTDRTGASRYVVDRLRGTTASSSQYLETNSTIAEAASGGGLNFANNTGFTDAFLGYSQSIFWNFRRAPGFFDVVCYTGTGSARTVAHNLGVAPELMILKRRDSSSSEWPVYAAPLGATQGLYLGPYADPAITTSGYWNNTAPTSSVFTVGNASASNFSGSNLVAYLFASCPGVSKVGSYTGNGSSQTINMGFTGGARFFLVKRTDSTGDWWVYDSARGIVSAADPALRLNSTAAEVTSADAVDTDSTGLIVNQESTCNINVSSATYIYLGIS